jgi:hypothetical protein
MGRAGASLPLETLRLFPEAAEAYPLSERGHSRAMEAFISEMTQSRGGSS